MYELSISASVRRWGTYENHRIPSAISMVCPLCRATCTFTPTWDRNRIMGMPFLMACPSCAQNVKLIGLDVSDKATLRLFVDAERPERPPVHGLDSVPEAVLPPRLRKAYQSALNVLAIGEAEATAVTCRRVLEGVTERLLTDSTDKRKTLASMIRALAEQSETLAQPLIDISESLRSGGNLGAHFDPDGAEPSIEDAEHMVDLLDYLLTYLYVVPQQVHQFRVNVLGGTPPQRDSEPA